MAQGIRLLDSTKRNIKELYQALFFIKKIKSYPFQGSYKPNQKISL